MNRLVNIKVHRANGKIDSELYPSYEDFAKGADKEHPLADVFEQQQKQEESLREKYEHYARFAEKVHIYEDRTIKVVEEPMGYCIATFASTSEAQNCYFQLRTLEPMDLMGSKREFEFDASFKRRLLRFIDNQFVLSKEHFDATDSKKPVSEKEQIAELVRGEEE